MKEVNTYQAKTQFSRLLRRVAAGEEITIANRGVPVARLVPLAHKKEPRVLGIFRGQLNVPEDFAIKFARDSLPLPKAPSEYISVALRTWGLRTLDITHEHALRAGELPAHHRDPFDRLLIAQAAAEKMTSSAPTVRCSYAAIPGYFRLKR
jgi:prevent-host-death family protein